MKTCVALVVLLAAVNVLSKTVIEFEQPEDGGKHWALLVAGSNGWSNYRHQADVCHAYQVIKSHGVPEENIIVMMYDDIADNSENPEKGIIINQPNGPDVYKGVKIDYKGREVNPTNFLSVLKGDASAVNEGPVINSGPKDHIFVNFVDHGAPGIIAFMTDVLKAKDLNLAIKQMHKESKYAKMVFYVEACESGSMFENLLPENINVFATTASNSHESSYACYFDKKRGTYLGDVYSIKWMQDSDKEDLTMETLQKQFGITKSETNTSHVMEYGDLKMGQLTVAEFQGNQKSTRKVKAGAPKPCADAVKSEDVPLEICRRMSVEETISAEERNMYKMKLDVLEKEREHVVETFKAIVNKVMPHHTPYEEMFNSRHSITRWDCYYDVLDYLQANCKHLNIPENDYALRQLKVLVNMCEVGVAVEEMMSAIDKTC